MFGLRPDCIVDVPQDYYTLSDYESGVARWCPSCGDHAVLTAVQKLCRDEQMPPEKTVFVSGIGCSSRFPHYMKTYGFHGLHGRAFPVACGIKFRRPDLKVFVATGDGDCCSIGAGHWIHAIRYNMDMTVMLLNNEIYGLTKKQTSPTSRLGTVSNTHPKGSMLAPINPVMTTLGVANVSFVAQTVDWNPMHLFATLKQAYEHPGFSFVHILQRCPHFQENLFDKEMSQPEKTIYLYHEKGINLDERMTKVFTNKIEHDPSNIHRARELAEQVDATPIGLLYQNTQVPRYDLYGQRNMGFSVLQKQEALNRELDKFAV